MASAHFILRAAIIISFSCLQLFDSKLKTACNALKFIQLIIRLRKYYRVNACLQ